MPGPSNKKKRNNKAKKPQSSQPPALPTPLGQSSAPSQQSIASPVTQRSKSAAAPSSLNTSRPSSNQPKPTPQSVCSTLEEDEMTRCTLPPTDGHPTPNRCKQHYNQYRLLCKKYKDAQGKVDQVKNSGELPTDAKIKGYTDRAAVMAKLKWVSEYVEAIRVERTGRDLHSRRFFLKADDGHKIRIKVLAKEMENANKILEKLNKRAMQLYIDDHPEAEWARMPADEEILQQTRKKSEEFKGASRLFGESRVQPPGADDPAHSSDDLIRIQIQAQKRKILYVFEWLLDLDSFREYAKASKMISEDGDPAMVKYAEDLQYYVFCQYARRVIFYEPTLFIKSLGKISFRDFFLNDDLEIEDCSSFMELFMRPDELPLPWFKDSIYEGLHMMQQKEPQHGAANIGDTGGRIFILGGWIYNHAHRNSTPDKVWYYLFKMVGPQANTENRYVRLCDSYDDMIRMLSMGGLGLLPPPGFCKSDNQSAQAITTAARMHLSLSGVVTADLVSPQLTLHGPVPTTKPPQSRGNIVWVDVESRGYLFGAIRYEKDRFSEAFLQELKARPDLFQLILWRQGDPKSKVEEAGSSQGKAFPVLRSRQFEAPPRWNLSNEPQGRGEWETFRSANDILFSTKKEKILGYITTLEQTRSAGWFFHFKKFPVRYFVVLDGVPNRHGADLIRNVAWAALRAGGYAAGDLTTQKYYKASDKLFQEKAAQRLSWMDPAIHGTWGTTKMANSDDETDVGPDGEGREEGRQKPESDGAGKSDISEENGEPLTCVVC